MKLIPILFLMFTALALASCGKPVLNAAAAGIEGLPVDATPCVLPAIVTAEDATPICDAR